MAGVGERRRLWAVVLARDGGRCQDCGKIGEQVHHIVHRGQAADSLIWRPENMILLCAACHRKANTLTAKRRHLQRLEGRHGYKYKERPWLGILA